MSYKINNYTLFIHRCLILLCCLGSAPLWGQQSRVFAKFDSTHLEIGNPTTLRIFVENKQPSNIDFSVWDSLIPPENRLSESDWQVKDNIWQKKVQVIAFDSAHLELPGLPVQTNDGQTSVSNPLTLDVGFKPDADPDLADLKDIHREQAIWTDYWPVFLALGLLTLGALLWWWLAKRKKKPAPVISRVIELPPHTIALKKLDLLREKQLWQNGQHKEYYSELTFIAREYLEKRYQIPALESTSDEIIHSLRKLDFDENLQSPLREVLQWADMAKFAKGTPPDSFHEAAFEKVKDLVMGTTSVIMTNS